MPAPKKKPKAITAEPKLGAEYGQHEGEKIASYPFELEVEGSIEADPHVDPEERR